MKSRCKYLPSSMIHEPFRSAGIVICAAPLAPPHLALLASLLQLPVALRVDRGPPTREHVVRRHVPDRAVQPDKVIVIHILLNQAFRIFQRQGRSLPNAFPFQRLVPALELPVGVSCQLRHNVTLKDNDSVSFIPIIPGTDANLNC